MFGVFSGEGKVVSVVGAAGRDNMGQVIARRFAERGAKVVVSGRNSETLAELAAEIDGDWVPCDLCDRDSISQMVNAIVEAVMGRSWATKKKAKPFQVWRFIPN